MLSSVAASDGPNRPKSNAVTPTSDSALMSPTIVGSAAGEQLALAVHRAFRLRLRVGRYAIGQPDGDAGSRPAFSVMPRSFATPAL